MTKNEENITKDVEDVKKLKKGDLKRLKEDLKKVYETHSVALSGLKRAGKVIADVVLEKVEDVIKVDIDSEKVINTLAKKTKKNTKKRKEKVEEKEDDSWSWW